MQWCSPSARSWLYRGGFVEGLLKLYINCLLRTEMPGLYIDMVFLHGWQLRGVQLYMLNTYTWLLSLLNRTVQMELLFQTVCISDSFCTYFSSLSRSHSCNLPQGRAVRVTVDWTRVCNQLPSQHIRWHAVLPPHSTEHPLTSHTRHVPTTWAVHYAMCQFNPQWAVTGDAIMDWVSQQLCSKLHFIYYRIAGNFRGVKYLLFSWASWPPRNFNIDVAYRNIRIQAGNQNFYSRKPQFLELNELFTPRKLPAIRYASFFIST